MTAKEKYLALLKGVVANEAISGDKLKLLIKRYKTNKDKTVPWLKKGGVLEDMGQDVYRVLVRGKDLEGYAEWLAWQASPKKKGGVIKNPSKPPSGEYPYHEILDKELDAGMPDPKPYFDDPDMEAAEEDIDIHAKMLDMVNSFMEQVQTNTNKQNEHIAELEKRLKTHITTMYPHDDSEGMMNINERVAELENTIKEERCVFVSNVRRLDDRIVKLEERMDRVEQQIGGLQSRHDKLTDLVNERFKSAIEGTDDLDNRMDAMDNKIDSQVEILDRNIKALWQIFTGHKNEIRNGGALKALHTLLGELI